MSEPRVAIGRRLTTDECARLLEPAEKSEIRVISMYNAKGGTGKTTNTIVLSNGIAGEGRKVLCVDLAPQRDLTQLFLQGSPIESLLTDGVWGESGLPVPSVFDALTQMSSLDEDTRRGPINLLEVEGVFLLRGDPRTDLFTERVHESMALSYMIPKETALVMTSFSRLMSGLALSHGFTHVIVDLSSSAMALNGLAVMSSHDVCVAAQPSPLMRWTDRVLIEVFQRWQEKIGPFLENTEMQRWKGDVAGIIMNQASRWPADFTSTVGPNATLVSVPPLRGQIIGSYFDKTRAPLSVLVDRLVGRMTPPE